MELTLEQRIGKLELWTRKHDLLRSAWNAVSAEQREVLRKSLQELELQELRNQQAAEE